MPMNQSAFGQTDGTALSRRSHSAAIRPERRVAYFGGVAHPNSAPHPSTTAETLHAVVLQSVIPRFAR